MASCTVGSARRARKTVAGSCQNPSGLASAVIRRRKGHSHIEPDLDGKRSSDAEHREFVETCLLRAEAELKQQRNLKERLEERYEEVVARYEREIASLKENHRKALEVLQARLDGKLSQGEDRKKSYADASKPVTKPFSFGDSATRDSEEGKPAHPFSFGATVKKAVPPTNAAKPANPVPVTSSAKPLNRVSWGLSSGPKPNDDTPVVAGQGTQSFSFGAKSAVVETSTSCNPPSCADGRWLLSWRP